MHHTIEVQDLRFSFPDGRQALRGVDLSIAPGEKVGLVGPNGAGKSTLMLHLNGILRAGSGAVQVCGQPVDDDHLAYIRRAVGLVFQDPDDQLFSPTVFEDVAFGPMYMGLTRGEVEQRVQAALAAVGMHAASGRVPHHLSSGEKKRVAIATVLAMEPEILVLDEPSAGLDPRARRELINLLRRLPQTMLVSTHDLWMVQELFERSVVIDGGRIVADGPTQTLLSTIELLEAHGLVAP
ncbi:MAG: energy-coupling factor ABC transporter ATP-binding protein [Anaerolineales bacterium]|nr:energy-coupling factor ABC transporter ATP-binding protein [Anaerolineales bacterium]